MTSDVELVADEARAALDDDHRAVVQVADALAGLLALGDDLDPQRVAGQQRRLQRVGQRVDVQDADRLQVRHAVQVEVVGQDGRTARPGQGDQLGVDVARLGRVVVTISTGVGPSFWSRARISRPAPAAGAPLRVGAVGDPLQLVEDEVRDHQPVIQEARVDDVGDPAVDDGARVDHDLRLAAPRGLSSGVALADEAGGLGGGHEVLALGDGQAEHPQAEADRDADRQVAPVRLRQLCKRQAQQERDQQADEQTRDGRDELGRGHGLDGPDDAARRHDRQIRQQQETDGDPGGDPDRDQQTGLTGLLERRLLGQHEPQADQGADRRTEQPNDADHDGTPFDEAGG